MANLAADPSRYSAQLEEKTNRLKELFSELEMPVLSVFASPPLHYRMRAEFRVWHDQDDLYYISGQEKQEAFSPSPSTIAECSRQLVHDQFPHHAVCSAGEEFCWRPSGRRKRDHAYGHTHRRQLSLGRCGVDHLIHKPDAMPTAGTASYVSVKHPPQQADSGQPSLCDSWL